MQQPPPATFSPQIRRSYTSPEETTTTIKTATRYATKPPIQFGVPLSRRHKPPRETISGEGKLSLEKVQPFLEYPSVLFLDPSPNHAMVELSRRSWLGLEFL
jgi:hypothetical protein